MTSWIIVALLLVALVLVSRAFAQVRAERDVNVSSADFERMNSKTLEHAVQHEREEVEKLRARCKTIEAANAEQRDKILALEHTLASANGMHAAELARLKLPKRPARFALHGGMTEDAIAEQLHGTEKMPMMLAVVAHISAEIVRLADVSTDAPRDPVVLPDRIIPGYSAEQRLHDAGGASHLAELLEKLQELSRPVPQEGKQTAA